MHPTELTNVRRFETYVRWSLYCVAVVHPFWLMGSAPVLVDRPAYLTVIGVVLVVASATLNVMAYRWSLDHMRDRQHLTPRTTLLAAIWAMVTVVLAAYYPIWLGIADAWPAVSLIICIAALGALMPVTTWRQAWLITGSLIVLNAIPAYLIPNPLSFRTGYWLGSGLLAAFLLISTWSTAWMLRVLYELQRAREDSSRLAVAEERVRISRDLHDVFGRTLATIAVKSEFAGELVRRQRTAEAAEEISAIRGICDTAGKEVRRVVRGEVEVSLGQEIDGARALLSSAGIACEVTTDVGRLEPGRAERLGWVLREGATNILRHSRATRAALTVEQRAGLVVLSLSNDGADLTGTAGSGTGLASMRERLAPVDGTLSIDHDEGWFTLTASVPEAEGST